MSEHPIIFSGEMIRAILAGKKTQTRRVVKPQPPNWTWSTIKFDERCVDVRYANLADGKEYKPYFVICPYGQIGDHLWVKETFTTDGVDVWYKATNPPDPALDKTWSPSIFMPRWASRIILEITGVRVERVQEISAEDALAEGMGETGYWKPKEVEGKNFEEKWWDDFYFWGHYPQRVYAELWDSLNAKRGYSWESNPWVWVIEIKKVQA